MKIALVTGASSGLGEEFVRQIASMKNPPEAIWAVARRKERLEALQQVSAVPVVAIPLDLTQKESIIMLKDRLQAENAVISLLVNGAGLGKIGSYAEIALEDADQMIDLNCRAAVDVTLAALPHMQRGSRILHICSTSAFQPFPYLNIYAATKAFLYRFSRALRIELMGRGIRVTAVCPYWIKDTEFITQAQKTEGSRRIRHFWLASHKKSVVRLALLDSRLGLPVSTPGPVCLVHRIAAKFIPSEIMMGLWSVLRKV